MSNFIHKLSNQKLIQPRFIPMSKEELSFLGWDLVDVLLITGDAYVDHSSFGAALIGRCLIAAGYKVGIISQPDWKDKNSLKILGTPKICCAITSGNMDSMLNIYTAGRRIRKEDAYSPGGIAGLRPPRALSVYSNLAKGSFPGTPIIIGGIEASMRRIAHYDYWKDEIMPSILTSTKADILVYGMGEKATINIVEKISSKNNLSKIPGTAVLLGKKQSEEIISKLDADTYILPSLSEIMSDKNKFIKSHLIAEENMNPFKDSTLIQLNGDRAVVIEKPELPLTPEEMDFIYSLPFAGNQHPKYSEKIPAFEMIKDSITIVRGCPGGCAFCGLGFHQGKFTSSRSEASVVNSLKDLSNSKAFKGTVSDLGGPTANTYGCKQKDLSKCKICKRASCLYPTPCSNFEINESDFLSLLHNVEHISKIKHTFINSGLRTDLAKKQPNLMKEIILRHTSGHFKIAPEHLEDSVLKLMRKNKSEDFYDFVKFFDEICTKFKKKQYIVPYFISNFPGCTEEKMKMVDNFLTSQRWSLEQVQDFIPLPMTIASAMYYAEMDINGTPIKVNKGLKERRPQIKMLKKKR